MFYLSGVCYAFVRVCLYVPCGHLLGKGWPLGSRLWCLTVSLSLSHWYPVSGMVLDCIDSWSLHPYLLRILQICILKKTSQFNIIYKLFWLSLTTLWINMWPYGYIFCLNQFDGMYPSWYCYSFKIYNFGWIIFCRYKNFKYMLFCKCKCTWIVNRNLIQTHIFFTNRLESWYLFNLLSHFIR